MPLFSVIIPVHNRATLVGKTLDSVFAQSLTDFEVIVVDDGSTDGGYEMLQEHYAGRLTLLRQANQGPGMARNLGARAAKGTYLAFLDSDDLWFPWTLATYRAAIDAHGGPAFLAAKSKWFRDERELEGVADGSMTVDAYPDFLASSPRGLFFGASWFVVKREAFERVGGFTDRWINAEDHDLGLRLGTASGFVLIESPVTLGFRRHEGTAWSNSKRTNEGTRSLVEQELAGRYPGGAARRWQRRRLIAKHTRTHSVAAALAGEKALAWWLYRRTFGWNLRQGRLRYLLAVPLLLLKPVRNKEAH
jgi:glycosyltransferase involved in cell wall biosynthesis